MKVVFPNPFGNKLPDSAVVDKLQKKLGFSEAYRNFLKTQNGISFKRLNNPEMKGPFFIASDAVSEGNADIECLYNIGVGDPYHDMEENCLNFIFIDFFLPIGTDYGGNEYVEILSGTNKGKIASLDHEQYSFCDSLEEYLKEFELSDLVGASRETLSDALADEDRAKAPQLGQVLDVLRRIYPNDTAFKGAFMQKSIKTTQNRNAKVVRYILCKLEKQDGGIDFDADSTTYTIEHVLPQSPQEGWDAFHDRDLENFVYRLSNMVMLESGKNKDIGNKPYADKRPILIQSNMTLTRKLAEENIDWIPKQLEARQRQLANLATSIWRITQLS